MKIKNCVFKYFSLLSSIVVLVSIVSFQAGAQELPNTMEWSCYDVGSSGYVQASAIADAFGKKYETKIRLRPSGTSIGRLTPLTHGRVDCGFLANENFFAAEGTADFAAIEYGPQDLRVILAMPTSIALATPETSGIDKIEDLKGKRVSYIPGAPTLNIKAEAFLAFAGLTWDDVEKVEFSGYADALRALIDGDTDASVSSTTASILFELESSHRGIHYPEFPAENKEGWKRMKQVAPFLSPMKETIGAGISEDDPIELPAYRYPMITVYSDADDDFVYSLIKAMDQTYDLYKDAHPEMKKWAIDKAGVPPADVPFHKGAVKYLKEKGIWTKEHNAWNKEKMERMEVIQDAWERALSEAHEQEIGSKKFPEFWLEIRSEVLEKEGFEG